ncbi:nitrogen fixation/metabolism regulation signal transduction histidine kinase [Paenibacillus jamilae]|jgi:nitrogen fixation/metabolism regulation signal transduction histidine kinase|uniref:sensor histidine kinase n=1 Tax=Paenibacillus TaxID=44249 RepID=UPI0008D140B5|nr:MULTISPECIES: sensor histidine kinase [Paenibacillus]MDP9675956.1 nitrogen fixation/metabolism regulation signal transduction histidine kinase [Paenibacillus jamilae]MBY0021099.1 sensor histidine kinase [Paenibacillus polymyxa]MBY0057506.1 sensor histidine kinase [Paenibacillus polymyxa]MBY0070944.1 sensor histidine kinase [Paenibacillus polymyxa]MBY0082234.1 sensor histidine kinase [Paenibacillus polymyxa]
MTIRTKLLLFIPLLVVFANIIAYFVFQSGKVVQQSYDEMLGRILLIEQTSESAEGNLNLLYTYLLNPRDETGVQGPTEYQLKQLKGRIQEVSDSTDPSFAEEDYMNLLATFLEQKQAAVLDAKAQDPQSAFEHYIEAEKTVGYIHEEGQRLIDAELAYYRPLIENIRNKNEQMNGLGVALFGMNALMGVLLAIWVSRSITGPVGRLVGLAKRIATGDLNIEPQPRRDDELGVLADAILQMSADLSILIEKDKQSLEMRRLVKELELLALQNQINPHFLFNTLNVLSKLAILEGAEKTSDLIVSLSNLLRYSLQKLDKPVTLQEELDHISEYVTIQQARFRDRIRFDLHFDASVLQQQIPALTIQPFIENAFLHGVADMENGAIITLTLSRAGEDVQIEISDNGKGMTEETRLSVLRLEGGAESSSSTGLGMQNVFRRLQLFYEKEGMVEIRSHIGLGTTITIRIPVKKESEQTNVSVVDRG